MVTTIIMRRRISIPETSIVATKIDIVLAAIVSRTDICRLNYCLMNNFNGV